MLIIEKSSLFDIYAEKGIVIFKNSCNLKQIRTLPCGLIAVFDSKNAAVRNFLMGRSISAVSCGLGTGDTLNISGIGDDAAVSLQRELATLDGELNLPQELVVKNIGALSASSVMSLCAVLLLTRKSDGLSIDLNFH